MAAKIAASLVNIGTTGFNYLGQFSIAKSEEIREVGLLGNIRVLASHFVYLFLLLWAFVTRPALRWMLENRIYHSRPVHSLKHQ